MASKKRKAKWGGLAATYDGAVLPTEAGAVFTAADHTDAGTTGLAILWQMSLMHIEACVLGNVMLAQW